MTTTIYLDLLFFENFFLDFFILYATSRVTNKPFKIARGALGSLIGALYVCFSAIFGLRFIKIIAFFPIIALVLFATFKISGVSEFFKLFFSFISLCFVLAGGIRFSSELSGKTSFFSIFWGILILMLTGKEIFMLIKKSILKKEFTKEALLFYNDKVISLKAFEDTGNFLVDPISKRSVVVISKDKLKKLTDISDIAKIKNIRLIPCRTVANKFELLYGFKPDRFIYDGKETNAVVAASKESFESKDYDAILNPLTLV